ncbi:flagellar type III secretion system pore protein FliP [Pseudooceanicola sp. LIPI14-2-Ac024]|uniref:flagellar type III secretion system pore protein FliP n=1 Tax=Pseudooceanicola sp. LIPI14-2-Ac024 TaxID=3344875 RepID=UPI0035CEB985
MIRPAISTRWLLARLLVGGGLLLCLVAPLHAQDAASGLLNALGDALSNAPAGSDDRATLSGRILQIVAAITVLSIAPGLLVIMTSFTRFIIVFSMLRSALGLNQTPPNMVLTSMALFMTFFVMQPVFEDAWQDGVQPLMNNTITEEQALQRIGEPFKTFMFVNTRPKDLELFHTIAAESAEGPDADPGPLPDTAEATGWSELVPAFMISELRRAFSIGFLIYLPFLAIDLIVASILMSAGMMMLPPVLISLPFKVIFFVLIDGWYMLAGSLLESYGALSGSL